MRPRYKRLLHLKEGWGPDLYDDGVITFSAPKRTPFTRAFRKLERRLGINTERVDVDDKPDIICKWKSMSLPYAGWHFRRYDFDDERAFSQIEVRPSTRYIQSTVVHEIGHALGLGHPMKNGREDHSREDTIMSYRVQGDISWFTPLDEAILIELYG